MDLFLFQSVSPELFISSNFLACYITNTATDLNISLVPDGLPRFSKKLKYKGMLIMSDLTKGCRQVDGYKGLPWNKCRDGCFKIKAISK